MSDGRVLSVHGLVRRFRTGTSQLLVLDEVDLEIRAGEIIGLVGPSGSGKSSLLHAAGLLEEPTAGSVSLNGDSAWEMDDGGRTAVRRENIGFVYQFHHLLPEFTALENAALPALIAGRKKSEAVGEARRLLEKLGLGERLNHRPSQLSGGEQQRVAIARALVNKPLLILADEPTGNLDPDTAAVVFNELAALVRAEGAAALIATHNYQLAGYMDRVVGLSHGKLIEIDQHGSIEAQLAAAPKRPVVSSAPEQKQKLYPWARLWAKLVDMALYGSVVGGVAGVLIAASGLLGLQVRPSFWLIWLFILFSFPVVDAALVSSTGGSPGRAVFRFAVRRRNGERPSFGTALARAWTWLFFGHGLGIVWPLTYWASYANLKEYQASLWDRDAGTEVVHRGPKWWSWIAPVVYAAFLGAGLWFWAQALHTRLSSGA